MKTYSLNLLLPFLEESDSLRTHIKCISRIESGTCVISKLFISQVQYCVSHDIDSQPPHNDLDLFHHFILLLLWYFPRKREPVSQPHPPSERYILKRERVGGGLMFEGKPFGNWGIPGVFGCSRLSLLNIYSSGTKLIFVEYLLDPSILGFNSSPISSF